MSLYYCLQGYGDKTTNVLQPKELRPPDKLQNQQANLEGFDQTLQEQRWQNLQYRRLLRVLRVRREPKQHIDIPG
jgi:hypothetical protein